MYLMHGFTLYRKWKVKGYGPLYCQKCLMMLIKIKVKDIKGIFILDTYTGFIFYFEIYTNHLLLGSTSTRHRLLGFEDSKELKYEIDQR